MPLLWPHNQCLGSLSKVNDKLNKWVTVKDALSIIPDPDGANANSVPNNEYSNYKLLGVIE